jgi:hypothetical protein
LKEASAVQVEEGKKKEEKLFAATSEVWPVPILFLCFSPLPPWKEERRTQHRRKREECRREEEPEPERRERPEETPRARGPA